MAFPPDARSDRRGFRKLLGRHVPLFAALFALLEFWRPCYFLTDDSLSGYFPVLTEIGRRLKEGKSPFFSDYIFGGNYDLLRDMGSLYWHPFYILPTLLADTPGRFWIVDVIAFLLLLFTLVGFTLLAWRLREEFNPALPDLHLTFYTFSFVFSTYILTIGASWINFLGTASALPWLALGILERRAFYAVVWVAVITAHEILAGFAPLSFSAAICLTFFAFAIAIHRRVPLPVVAWIAGSLLGIMLMAPLLRDALDGFAHAPRSGGISVADASLYTIPATTFPFSLIMGNWTELVTRWRGDPTLATLRFPYASSLLACAAAWCVFPALAASRRWRLLETLCLVVAAFIALLMIRPAWLGIALHQVPFLKSMRWPFREGLIFLFYLHIFLVLRPEPRLRWLQPAAMVTGLALFLLPLPFIRVPTLNALALDRAGLFSGTSEVFWTHVKARLRPGDQIVTVINWTRWTQDNADIPYSFTGTANFPAFFRVKCASGYSPTAPRDTLGLKLYPWYWFGAYRETQVADLLAENPHLVIFQVEGTRPLRISMTSDGEVTDLTPWLPQK